MLWTLVLIVILINDLSTLVTRSTVYRWRHLSSVTRLLLLLMLANYLQPTFLACTIVGTHPSALLAAA
uniref:Putative secreted peptide n=1 Tax=Anopheles braziliensis TaxID=58242 RepID=A0A2M3ZTM1_9DIPT